MIPRYEDAEADYRALNILEAGDVSRNRDLTLRGIFHNNTFPRAAVGANAQFETHCPEFINSAPQPA
jgi:hypothetical protein